MRIGVISDIHANLVALEAVLDDMPPVDRLACAGDVIGYNPWPAECVERVRERCAVTVRGNHDRNADTPNTYSMNRMAHEGLKLASERLSEAQRRWLRDLPRTADLTENGVLLVHDHPEHVDQYVRPHSFPQLRPYLDDYEACILGHTHVQHEATVDGRLILNPGSVGQPRDEDPRAAYAVVDTAPSPMVAHLHRVEYDVAVVQEACREAGLPERTAERLELGR
ncbi:metallophosphoesterase [Halobacteriales archaeon QS_4_70_19]|nr:MAG: metallophosphoesterase [Halobacteriales archaeon QS_4_70_19]